MTPRHLIALLLFAIATCTSGMAQSVAQSVALDTLARDTLAFRQYLSDNFGTRINVKAIFSLYQRLSRTYTKAEREKRHADIHPSTLERTISVYSPPYATNETLNLSGTLSYGYIQFNQAWRIESFLVPDSLRNRLRKEIRNYDYGIRNRKEDKESLVRALAAFDSVTVNKPIFFADIYSKFNGDYRKYVNHLYRRSILLKNSRMMYFTRHPTAKKLQSDPGVQFVISLALYESWIKDVREGRVKNTSQL